MACLNRNLNPPIGNSLYREFPINDLLDKVEGELEAERRIREETSAKLEKKLSEEVNKNSEIFTLEKRVREET